MDDETENIEDNTDAVNSIMLWRIYDVLLGIYSNVNPEEAQNLVKLHEDGIFVTPPPAYREGQFDDE